MATMKRIEINGWKRQPTCEFFMQYELPQYNVTTQLNVQTLRPYWDRGVSVFRSILFLVSRAVNSVPELRQRVRKDHVVEWDVIHPAFTDRVQGDLFGFCRTEFVPVFQDFEIAVRKAQTDLQNRKDLYAESDLDNQIFVSSLPWFALHGLTQPMKIDPMDSVPRITWGKVENHQLGMNIQVHHALVDGVHIGRFFDHIQEDLNQLGILFSK